MYTEVCNINAHTVACCTAYQQTASTREVLVPLAVVTDPCMIYSTFDLCRQVLHRQ